jgi:3-methyladenine DNA glycosylase/8-oxoguanine DNA glycosylase
VGAQDSTFIELILDHIGIGRWTAEMFLMFRLGRPAVHFALAVDRCMNDPGF